MTEQLLADVGLADIPPEVIDAVDLSMPQEFMDGAMAVDMVSYLRQYHSLDFQQKAALHNEDHKRAEEINKNKLFAKTVLGYIQWKHPGAKKLADEMMVRDKYVRG